MLGLERHGHPSRVCSAPPHDTQVKENLSVSSRVLWEVKDAESGFEKEELET